MKKAKVIFSFIINFFIITTLSLSFASAQSGSTGNPVGNPGTGSGGNMWSGQIGMEEVGHSYGTAPGEVKDVRYTIVKIINVILTLLGILLVVLIIAAGFMWMTAGGNEDKVKKAKSMLTNAVIGLLIIMVAWSVTRFILSRMAAIQRGDPNYIRPFGT